jgi:hypothetical protein
MSTGSVYPYEFTALPPSTLYIIDAFIAASPTQTGRSQANISVSMGSTVTGVNFGMSLGQASLSGTVSYSGIQNYGDYILSVTTTTDFSRDVVYFGSFSSPVAGGYSIPNLPAPSTYYIIGFRDVNYNRLPDGAEPFGVYGNSTGPVANLGQLFTPIYVTTGMARTGLNVNLNDRGSMSGLIDVSTTMIGGHEVVIQVGHGTPLSSSYQLESNDFLDASDFPVGGGYGYYSADLLRPATDYSVLAFIDVNHDDLYSAGEPFVQAVGPLTVPQGGYTNQNLTISSGTLIPSSITGFTGTAISTAQIVWSWNLTVGA